MEAIQEKNLCKYMSIPLLPTHHLNMPRFKGALA
jgi:hypothetical protein